MWQSPAARMRQSSKRRDDPRMKYHLLKVTAEIKLQASLGESARILAASIVLNDLSPSGVAVFSEGKLTPGQEVFLTLDNPKRFYARGQIISCQDLETTSKILSSQKSFGFRVGILFKFDNEKDKEEVYRFCTEIEKSLYEDSSEAA